MTRTVKGTLRVSLLSCLITPFLLVGCGPDEKDLKIEDLTAENDQLKRELSDRDRQLQEALARENEARATVDELNRELARSRSDLASARANANASRSTQPVTQMRSNDVAVKGADGWISTPSFDMISIPGEILFNSGKANLSRNGKARLAQVASDIRSRFGDRDIFVFGHTDNDPIRKSSWKDNWELGSARALNVIRELQKRGVPGDNLIQASCGEYRPTAANNRSTKKQNRRVEFYAVRKGGVLSARAN